MDDRNHAPLFVWEKNLVHSIIYLDRQAWWCTLKLSRPKVLKKDKYISVPKTFHFHCEKRLIALLPQLLPTIYM